MNEQKAASIFKALSDENRLHIMQLLCGTEKCACDLLEDLNICQPTLSHHMKILCESGLVNARKDGKWMHYTICCEGVREIRELLKAMTVEGILSEQCARCEK